MDKQIINYIYDEQFISIINSVSSSIKEYCQNNKVYMNNLKLCTDGINEQTLFSKSAVNDILVYLNQITNPKFNGTLANMNEKYIKEKLFIINDRINKINQYKNSLIENIKNSEMTFITFYDQAKNLFKKMKIIRNENIDDINLKLKIDNYVNNNSKKIFRTVSHSPQHNNNQISIVSNSRNKKNLLLNNSFNTASKDEQYSKLKNKYNELLKENQNLRILAGFNKKNSNQNNKNQNQIPTNTNQGIKIIKSKSLQKNKSDVINNINVINPNKKKNIKNNNFINQDIPISNSIDSSKNLSFVNNINLASMVLNFKKQMKTLQESISKKVENIHELKKNFELKKKEIIKLSETILENNNNNLFSVNNSQNLSPRNKKTFSPIIQQTPEKDYFKEKDYLTETINQLNDNIIKLKEEIKKKDENIQNEKKLNQVKEEQLNNEISQKNSLKEQNENFKIQIKDLNSIYNSQNNTIQNLTNMNNELLKGKNELNEKINTLLNENSNYQNKTNSLIRENKEYQIKLNSLNKENKNLNDNNSNNQNIKELFEKNKELQNENSTLKTDNQKLKKTISDYNTNMITLTNTNEEMIKKKDKIIDNLRLTINELNNQIENINKNYSNDNLNISKKINNEELINLKKSNDDFKEKINSLNKENRDLKNRMAEIKNEYVSHDEDLENLRKSLIEMNDNSNLKLNLFNEKKTKFDNLKEEFSKKINEEEEKKEIKNDNLIYFELENNSNDYLNYIKIIKQYSKKITNINSELENKINLQNNLNSELNSLKKENIKLKEQLEKLKTFLQTNKREKNEKEENKTLSDINEQNSNFIDEDLDIFLEKYEKEKNEKEKTEKEIIKETTKKDFDRKSFSSQPNPKAEHFSERKLSQHSNFSAEDNYQNNLKSEMETVKLLQKQLSLIKIELRETINQKNNLEKKVNSLSKKASLVDDNVLDKIEILQIIKQTFEKLVDSIQLVGKVKELVIMIFKYLNYSEEDIKKIIDKKEKRNLFGIFK